MKTTATFVVVTLAVAAAWALALPRAAVQQPMSFDHVKHERVGCVVCHEGSEKGVRAGLPDGSICRQCHATPPQVAGAEAAWQDMAEGRPIAWVRLSRVPDHVLFSHRRHVASGELDCKSCHGDVGRMSVPPIAPATNLSMAACESCHRQQAASNDCAGCHR